MWIIGRYANTHEADRERNKERIKELSVSSNEVVVSVTATSRWRRGSRPGPVTRSSRNEPPKERFRAGN